MKDLITNILLGVLIVLVAYSVFFKIDQAFGSSPTGSTFSTEKIAAVVFTPSSTSATTTSILNPTGQDVYVTSGFFGCQNATTSYTAYTGTGLASLNFKAATTSTANPANVTNTNSVFNMNIATGTSAAGGTPFNTVIGATSTQATTTIGTIGATGYWYRWAAGTYLTFYSNATNTATCTVGVRYFSS